ncbi:hypothetical protein HOG17_02810 [Candidatus Peregrinibacteria bacterium]|jgi:hypothetical protein|nr:hypothetical protein [Candidatus Peregrinibacteria bacterium]MBT4148039.1 hypothetical protein [Candidatus Peregrinibacteria bacterium]MBT4366057.1 hypothetical protein [Candidatus Peregrinibacteria bacterium]MBT4455560.1 hypothetical protein [Candidatus Peregrinibacteria bacterium]
MVRRGPDNLPPADEGSSCGQAPSYRKSVTGRWIKLSEPEAFAARLEARNRLRNSVPVVVLAKSEEREDKGPTGPDVMHPEIDTLSAIGTSNSAVGRIARETIADLSRTRPEDEGAPDSPHFARKPIVISIPGTDFEIVEGRADELGQVKHPL